MRKIILGLAMAAIVATPALAQKVGGAYTVEGTNPDGSKYSGTAEITPAGSTCHIVWNTGSTSKGICMLANKAFAAYYRLGKSDGLVVYELQPDGVLKGYWTITDQDGAGTETLIPAK
jgi:hypothetical protein